MQSRAKPRDTFDSMTTDPAVLTSLVWLAAMQFLLYAAGWMLCSFILRDEQRAILCWAGFMACIGLGFVLTTQRGEPRTWLAFNGSGVAFIAGLGLLWAGLASFYRRGGRSGREPLFTVGVLAAALLAMDATTEHAPFRVLLTYAADMWITLRIVRTFQQELTATHGRRLSLILPFPGYLIAVAFAIPFTRQLLNMDAPVEMHRFDHSNLRLIYIVTASAAVFNFGFMTLVTYRLVGRLRDLSQRDALTGLFNRRAMEQSLSVEWQRWRRSGSRFALVALDLDHFKRVNDQHGHPSGDAVLVETARRLMHHARAADVVARTGGEEFLIMLPDTDLDGARIVADRLLMDLRDHPVEHGALRLAVTASVGVARAEAEDVDVNAVVARADRALYRAKREGRDRVALSD